MSARPAQDNAEQQLVAVVGMGIAVPGASAPEEFWKILTGTTAMFSEPGDRFDLDRFWSADQGATDRTYARKAGYLHGLRPHPVLRAEEEDRSTPPLSQEARWLRHTLLQAQEGVRLEQGDRCGLYVGAWPGGSQSLIESVIAGSAGRVLSAPAAGILRDHFRLRVTEARTVLPDGVVRAAAAGIVGPLTDLLVVDTACSSSLYAVDLGTKALLAGECDVAYCGGVSALDPTMTVMFAKLRGLSPTGQVRAFDAAADGTLFSDGVGIVTLKLLSRAAADGDQVLGVLSGFGAAADGRGKSISAPNPAGQRRAVQRAREVSALAPEEIDWVVAHGTGTPVGDASELGMLASLAPPRGYVCSANKSLIGHTGWSAGVVSLIHALLALRHEHIPAQYGLSTPAADTDHQRVRIPVRGLPFPLRADRPRTVGISAFGFGGTNAHLLVSDRPDRSYAHPEPARTLRSNAPLTPGTPVLVAWSAHLPGDPSRTAVRAWLRGQGAGPPRSFGLPYPLPSPTEVRLPPRTLRAIDPCQVMALQVAARFAQEHGALWENVRERTGVIAAHMGLPRALTGTALRCYADDLTGALEAAGADEHDRSALNLWLAEVRGAVPPCSEDTQAGVLTNVIASRVASRLDLHGATLAVDAGLDGTQAALRVARSYLRTGELDLVLVLAANGESGPQTAETTGLDQNVLAEGAFLLAVATESAARKHGWPVLVRLDDIDDRRHGAATGTSAEGYLAVGGAVRLLQAVENSQNSRSAPPRTAQVTPAAQRSEQEPVGEVTTRYALSLAPTPHVSVREARPAIPQRSVVLLDGTPLPAAVTERLDRAEVVVVTTCPDSRVPGALVLPDPEAVDAAPRLREHLRGAAEHLTVLGDLNTHASRWPQPPAPSLLRLHDLMFLIAQQQPNPQASVASVAVLLAGHASVADAVHPYAAMFAGFVKSLAWERPDSPSFALLTDQPMSPAALDLLSAERGSGSPLPLVHYRNGVRHTESLRPAPLAGQPPLPVGDDSVVVVTGGTGGVPVALLHALAEHAKPRVWLLGRTRMQDLPAELLADAAGHTDLLRLRTRLLRTLHQDSPSLPVRRLVEQADTLLKARTVRLTLHDLQESFGPGRVRYASCDILDPAAVTDTVADILRTEGHVDLVLNAAGLFRPGLLERKSLESFRLVRDTKVRGYHHLKDAFADRPPRMWCNIGSYAGVAGLPGDTDYSAGNAYLNAVGGLSPTTAEHTIAFTLWRDAGLGTEPRLRERLDREGILTPVPTQEGVRQFLDELRAAPAQPGTSAYLGDRERRTLRAGRPGLLRDSASASAARPSRRPEWLSTRVTGSLGAARWHRTFTPATDPFLHDHLVDGKPTLPGTFMLEIAAQAAEDLAPGLITTGFRDARFDAFIRPFTGKSAFTLLIEAATITQPGAPEHVTRIRVDLRSDLLGPDGRSRPGARQHFHTDVLLAPPGIRQPPRRTPPGGNGTPAPDPYYAADSPVRLSGAFHNTTDGRYGEEGARATWSPSLPDEAFLRTMNIPALLICSALRTAALRPTAPGTQQVLVPRSLGRLDLFSDGSNDLALAARHGRSITLTQGTGTQFHAIDPDGRVLLEITDAQLAPMGPVTTPSSEQHRGPTAHQPSNTQDLSVDRTRVGRGGLSTKPGA